MKLPHALGFIALSSCLAAGCAGTGTARFAVNAPSRGGNAGLSAGVSAMVARGADDRIGSSLTGRATDADFRVNEAASFSEHERQFAGPTPQVPIPHDGRQGSASLW